ncbi:MAG TPA: LysR substrate-binding domain-containing protein [Verrucomicrobiae bacterium]|nr:LysR substrate-binding domain-containing protein [Verrucomicrobiae bacterium]
MFPGVDHRLLRYVVAVSEELHFRRAAEKLHVAQPPLSRQIRDLENQLGVRLLDRTNQVVRLTEAGAVFVREAKQALLHGERAVNLAKAITQPSVFSLGYSPYVSHEFVASIRALFASQFKNVRLSLVSAFADEELEQLQAGAPDAGLVTLPVAASALAVQRVLMEPLWVAISQKHRLGRVRTIRLRELLHLPMIAVAKRLCPQLHDRIHQAFARENSKPQIGQEVTTAAEAISIIVGGLGFAFVRECDHQFRCPGVAFKRIAGEPLILESGIVYQPDGGSPIIHALIAALQQRKEPSTVARNSAAAGLTA